MRILFVSAQLPGHLDWGGYLKTAAVLRRRDHDVLWATGLEMLPLLAQHGVPGHVLAETGWRWPPPPPLQPDPQLDPATWQQMRMVRSLDQWLDVERVRRAGTELAALGQEYRPHLLVSEMFVAAAGLVAELLAVPLVVAGWPALETQVADTARPVMALAAERLRHLLDHFGVQGANWVAQGPPALVSPYMHVTYWSPRWFAGLRLLPQNRHVGGVKESPGAEPSPWPSGLPADRPGIFITLGTSFADDPNFFVAAAHAAVQVGGTPILALGRETSDPSIKQLRARLPAPVVMTKQVEFGQVLPRVAAAIHHGGAGTTHALVTHAVPQIIVPHAADQHRQAQGVVRSGVGLALPPREVTVSRLVDALQAMLPEQSPYRTNAAALQTEFASLGGAPAAADLLENVAMALLSS